MGSLTYGAKPSHLVTTHLQPRAQQTARVFSCASFRSKGSINVLFHRVYSLHLMESGVPGAVVPCHED
jgi:hypothetical protein